MAELVEEFQGLNRENVKELREGYWSQEPSVFYDGFHVVNKTLSTQNIFGLR